MANNIITAAYSSSNITYTKPAYQYDYGMILKFSGIELPQAYEVHFSNTEFCGESISQIGDETGVTIPDEMFLNGNPIYAWTYLHTGEDDGETVYKAVISVNKRAKPSDLEPTPVQQDAITQAIAALNVAVEQTAADVVAAGESAEAAAGSAEVAGQAKDDAVEAQGKAEDAQEAAENAQEAAETAQGKAEDAQEAAEQAAGAVLGLTADASVDANTGTPSVEVNVSTVSDHKNMSFSFHNLKGIPGDPGEPGDDGFSPVVSVSSITGGHEVAVTDKNGTQTFDVMDGTDGQDGISPTITVTEISGGHEVSITDAEGTESFNVMDGLDGQSGLITDYIAEEKTPYLFRPSANGLANVISEKDMIVGGTVAWNQLVQYESISSPFTTGGITFTKTSNGEWSFSGTSTSTSNSISNIKLLANHIYLIREKSVTNQWAIKYGTFYRITSDRDGLRIVKQTSDSATSVGLQIYSNGLSVNGTIKPQLFDLTQMFGSTIADYLFTLESGSSGSGIAKLKEWGFLQKDYYPYNSGELMSVQTSAHVMRDADDNVIGNYPLDSDLVLRGIPKLDANNNLVYDGDVYRCDGSVQRRYGIVDLGTLSWGYASSPQVFGGNLTGFKPHGLCISTKYPQGNTETTSSDKICDLGRTGWYDGKVLIRDTAYTDATAFKTAMSGVYLIYELATPTSETADPYSEYQIVSSDGTEEYVDERTVPIPVGHDTFYQQSVDVPQLPTADGSYRLALSKTGNTATASWEYVAQAEMKAQTNIPSGKYFSVGERLFVSTQAIAQGANIVVGTNCVETTLADALNTINS